MAGLENEVLVLAQGDETSAKVTGEQMEPPRGRALRCALWRPRRSTPQLPPHPSFLGEVSASMHSLTKDILSPSRSPVSVQPCTVAARTEYR